MTAELHRVLLICGHEYTHDAAPRFRGSKAICWECDGRRREAIAVDDEELPLPTEADIAHALAIGDRAGARRIRQLRRRYGLSS